MYKSIILSVLILIGSWGILSAQDYKGRFEEIKIYKVAYLTEKMDLTVEEAQKFWPLYNEYEEAMQTIRQQDKSSAKYPSEEEAKSILYTNLELSEKEIALKRDFYKKASKVISYQKLYMMERGEREFRLKLLERFNTMRKKK